MFRVALKIHILLGIHRVDLAKEELKVMQEKDEDSSLTQLASAWVNLHLGGQFYQEAVYIYQELLDKSSALSDDDAVESSTTLLCGLAAAHMKLGNFEEAMKIVQRALKRNGVKVSEKGVDWGAVNARKPANVDLLVNLIACSQHLRKTGMVDQCLKKLEAMFVSEPNVNHPMKQTLQILSTVG